MAGIVERANRIGEGTSMAVACEAEVQPVWR